MSTRTSKQPDSNQPKQGASTFWSPLPWIAALLVMGCTFLLIAVGAMVTTLKAGMAVPDWPTTFGYNMFTYPLAAWLNGPRDVLVEHGHRLLGSLVGILSIFLVGVSWWKSSLRIVKYFSLVVLVAVILQGVLGGLRVLHIDQALAMIHGCTGQLFFAMAMLMVFFATKRWQEAKPIYHPAAGKVHALAVSVAGLTYLQVVFGAALRHFPHWHSVLSHLALATLLSCLVTWLAISLALVGRQVPGFRWASGGLLSVLLLQLLLGGGVWLARYGGLETYVVVAGGADQLLSTTGHVLGGATFFSLTLVIAVGSFRWLSSSPSSIDQPAETTASASIAEPVS
ncbi:Cytochrome oxidase biogenesis protein CtaA [Planctomycetales bacterium 10988]|nr:Cytochrome oxidase biogenesis protein CtaA [Planctomycetales bacterium 10988]